MNTLALQLLLSIEVEHDFFSHPWDCEVMFAADEEARALFDGCGCVVRSAGNGVFVHGDARAVQALRQRLDVSQIADETSEANANAQHEKRAPQLHFRAKVADTSFRNYTSGLELPSVGIPCFRSAFSQTPDASGRQCLHRGEHVIEADTTAFDAAPLRHLLSARERLHPPTFVVSIDRADLQASLASQVPARYRLRFASRATVWRYILAGDWGDDLRVVDVDDVARFGPPQRDPNADRPIVSVQSVQPIALKDRPAGRFQLRQGRGDGERVLIKRLPLASASRFGSETSGSTTNLISEIYVNR